MRATIATLRARAQRPEAEFVGQIRRMAIASTTGALSTTAGGEDPYGNTEREDGVEVFGVAGVRSRPSARGEAIAVRVGGRGHTVIVATRDRSMESAGDLAEAELAIETSNAFVLIKANGDILIGRPDGAFERVVTESHGHGPGVMTTGGGPVTGVTGKALVNPGTTPGETTLVGRGLAAVAKAETEVA